MKRPGFLKAVTEPIRSGGEFATSIGLLPLIRTLPKGDGHPVLVLFRRPVLDYWVEQGDELSVILTQVMVHEAAHQLELSDELVTQLEAEIEASAPQPRTVQ